MSGCCACLATNAVSRVGDDIACDSCGHNEVADVVLIHGEGWDCKQSSSCRRMANEDGDYCSDCGRDLDDDGDGCDTCGGGDDDDERLIERAFSLVGRLL